ncbi:MAG: DUF2247 family protein [Phascolarctobacterium sp.]|nr:DUF2247 family protein [Phascolarctobacterium sp.]
MYSFKIFAKTNITPSFNLIYLGISMDVLEPKAMQDFIYWKMEHDIPTLDEDFDVIGSEVSKLDVLEVYQKQASIAGSAEDHKAKDILRLVLLEVISKSRYGIKKKLELIELVYSTFEYPPEMNSFIYYMPSETGANSPEELMDNFHSFLAKEHNRLKI